MSDRYLWLLYVALAGLSWGTYVPIIFYGGSELGGKANARLLSFDEMKIGARGRIRIDDRVFLVVSPAGIEAAVESEENSRV